LNHPNVCVIHDIQENEDQQFIIMEYVDGKTLREIIDTPLSPPLPRGETGGSSLSTSEAIDIAIQIGEALQEAHNKGIVHRDVKSDNIMINSASQAKVMDFGLAKLKGSLKLTKSSSTVGTLAYMAPEQIEGKEIAACSDIFSFGVVLYEILTGHVPFKGEYEAALLYAILNDEPEPVEKHLPDISSELLHIINRSLEKKPEERYQSVNEMLIDLRRIKRDSDRISRNSLLEMPAAVTEKKTQIKKIGLWLIAGSVGLTILLFVLLRFVDLNDKKPPFKQLQITRLTSHGKAKGAVISPDGKYIVHVMEKEGKNSLWLRQVATNSNVQIFPPSDVIFNGLTFSNDGNYIYYNQRERNSEVNTLYKMPVLGGTPVFILKNVDSPISFSPDGSRFAFLRIDQTNGETAIYIAKSDGTEEKIFDLNKFPSGLYVSIPAWSPDGTVILCGEYIAGEAACRLVEINVDDKSRRIISSQKWRDIDNIVWLPTGDGYLLTASYQSFDNQIWYVSYPNDEVNRVSNDLNHYKNLSLTQDGKKLITVQMDVHANIWILPEGRTNQARQITSGRNEGAGGINWTPDGKILYAEWDGKIWSIDKDGKNPRQLSSDENYDFTPAVSPDSQSIFFTSSPISSYEIWKMNIDGSNRERLEELAGDPQLSPDGKWIVYTSFFEGKFTLRKISTNGGESVSLFDKTAFAATISHNGEKIACLLGEENKLDKLSIAVLPFEGGKPEIIFELPKDMSENSRLRWSINDNALTYFADSGGVSNIYSLPLNKNPRIKITNFKEKLMFYFDWSHNGDLACSRGAVVNNVVLIKDIK